MRKTFKLKCRLSLHKIIHHKYSEILKLKLQNENLELKIKLFTDQIKFLKRLNLIQSPTSGSRSQTHFRQSDRIDNTNPIPEMAFSSQNENGTLNLLPQLPYSLDQ